MRLAGRPPRLIGILLAIQIGLLVLYAFAENSGWIATYVGLDSGRFFSDGYLWQPFTAVWFHFDLRNGVLDAVLLWVYGPALFRWWGARRFLLFWYATSFVGLIVGASIDLGLSSNATLAGTQGASMAFIVACGILFSRHHVHTQAGIMPLKMKWLSLIVGGVLVLGTVFDRAPLTLGMYAGGGLTALAFLYNPRRCLQQQERSEQKKRFKVIDGAAKKKPPPKVWN